MNVSYKGDLVVSYETKNYFKIKAAFIIVAMLAAIFYIAGFTVFAEADYEAEFFSEDMLSELDAHKALVATEAQYEQYTEEFEDYVLGGGDLLVTSEEDGLIGKRYTAVDGEITIVPILAVAETDEAVDRSVFNYREILDDAVSTPVAKAATSQEHKMYLSVSFYIYANEDRHVATAGVYNYVDYYETRFSDVHYYNVYAEVYVVPKSNYYRVNSFQVDFTAMSNGDLEVKSRSNNSNITGTNINHSMGSVASSELPSGVSSTVSYGSVNNHPIDAVVIGGGAPVNVDTNGDSKTDEIRCTYDVESIAGGYYGRTYSAVFMHTYRTGENLGAGCIVKVHNVSITGKLWYPNYEEANQDAVAVTAGWDATMSERAYILIFGNDDFEIPEDFFTNFIYTCSLPQTGDLGGILVFGDE